MRPYRALARLAAPVLVASAFAAPGAHAAPSAPAAGPAEIAAFAAATHLPTAVARTYVALTPAVGDLQARGVADYAATFAGVWRTPADGGLVHVAFTRDAAASAARLTAGFARRDLVRVTTARTSLAGLEALQRSVVSAISGTPSVIGVDVVHGTVRVQTPALAAVRRALGTRFAGSPVRVVADRGAVPDAVVCEGRVCPASASGGISLTGNDGSAVYQCTAGFDATSTLTMAPTLVTAGHCFGVGGAAAPVGIVTARVWPGGDAEAIAQAYPPTNDVLWTFAGSHRTVTRVVGHGVSEAVGAAVCRTGITTENQCGTIQALNVTVTYVSGETVNGLTQASNCSQPGDSGGPFMSGNDAYGITSGGTVGACGAGTYSLYNPAPRIESSLGVRINTTAVV
jgi:streptogrisin C